MWPFSRVKKASVPRLVDLDERLADVERVIEWLKKADRDLNARLSAVQRVTNKKPIEGAVPEPDDETRAPPVPNEAVERRRRMRGF